jgi:hypothetical protein
MGIVLDSAGPGYNTVVCSCVHGYEPSDCMKASNFLNR